MIKDYSTRIILLVQNAGTIFTYFIVSPDTIMNFNISYGDNSYNSSSPILKLYYSNGDTFIEGESIYINSFADSWYIHPCRQGIDAFVKLGRVLENGKFVELAKSNVISIPRNSESWDTNIVYSDISYRLKESKDILSKEIVSNLSKESISEAK